MHIGISTSIIQRGRTGIAQHLFALLRALLPETVRHHFYLFVLEEDVPLFSFLDDRMKIIVVPEKFRPAVKNILWHQLVLPREARRLRLDVLHVPSYRRLLWFKPCRLVATIHDLAPFHVPGKYDWKRMLYARKVVRTLAQRQDEIITASESTARDIQTFFRIARKKINVVYNGVDHSRFSPAPTGVAIQTEARWHLKKPFALYVARLEHPGKNHVRLIVAFDRFKVTTGLDWQLALGGSDWHGAPKIYEAARRSPFASDIRFLGFVPDAELPDLYRAASLFVYPSLFEGFGMPPLEAMACGCPVLCSSRGSLGEVVGTAAAIIDPEDTDAMAHKWQLIATDPEARERLIQRGLLRAESFDWNRVALKTLEVYLRAGRMGLGLSPALAPTA
jgi:glycosyltransferase involved in cell wall biosynthesis